MRQVLAGLHPDAGDCRRPGRHGVATPFFLVVAVGCTLMMALMMGGMSHGGDDKT
jgi:hypothetical protein